MSNLRSWLGLIIVSLILTGTFIFFCYQLVSIMEAAISIQIEEIYE
jgi:hypothetical protein